MKVNRGATRMTTANPGVNDHLDGELGPISGHFRLMTLARFEALTLWGRPAGMEEDCRLGSAWATVDERILAAILHLNATREFFCVAFARDQQGRYRGFERSVMYPSPRAAAAALQRDFGQSLAQTPPVHVEAPPPSRGVDLFAPAAGATRLHDAFVFVRDSFEQAAAREILQEIARWFPNQDGHFVKEFQTAGYSARTWELYLWCAFRALGFEIDQSYAAPDFGLSKRKARIFVEATTVSARDPYVAAMAAGPPPDPPSRIDDYIDHDMAQKFGSPLYSKLKRADWEKPHVSGHPFVLALADFHAPASMRWSYRALPQYLYGLKAITTADAENRLIEIFMPGEDHVVGDKRVPTDFFSQPGAENVSAVLFSNAGTISKFNRMGARAGFGDAWVSLVRSGMLTDPEAWEISETPFKADVEDPGYQETWWDEITLYHNPKALHPVDASLFTGVTHVHVVDGQYTATGPTRVQWSQTTLIDFLGRKKGNPASG